MHVVVCLNQIPDPEAPWRDVRLNGQGNAPVLDRFDRVLGPFDENALELALQLRDGNGCRVTAVSLGPAGHEAGLRRALALRCDGAVHLREESAPGLDSVGVAGLLGAAIRRLGEVDLVLCGRQVGDWDGGQVGQMLAEELRFACATVVREVRPAGDGAVQVTREVARGLAVAEVRLPAVLTITNTAANQLRVPRVKDALAARRAPLPAWSAEELGLSIAQLLGAARRIRVARVYFPERGVRVRMIDSQEPEAAAARLVDYFLDLGLVEHGSAGSRRTP